MGLGRLKVLIYVTTNASGKSEVVHSLDQLDSLAVAVAVIVTSVAAQYGMYSSLVI